MPNAAVAEFSAALSTNATAGGLLTFGSNTGIFPGARGWMSRSDGNQRVIVVALIGTTQCTVRFIPENTFDPKVQTGAVKAPIYGLSDASAFTTAKGSRLELPAQVVEVDQPLFNPRPNANL